MGTYTGRDRFVRTQDKDPDRDTDPAGMDPEDHDDLIEDVLGESPTVWEMMLTGLPPGTRKRERRSAMI